jgi:septal ring factor EnvC (AmiA/AmiB activator)
MGLGGTAKKLQKVMDAAEQLYSKMNEVITELKEVQSEVETTSEQVDRIERDLAEQRALLEAVAEQQGIDVETVVDEVELLEGSDATRAEAGAEDGDTTTIYASDDE